MSVESGRVVRRVAGFFDVAKADCANQVCRCRARGTLRRHGGTVLVGDLVRYEPIGKDDGVITDVLPRKTRLVRPPMANADRALIVAAAASPELNMRLLDKMLISVVQANLRPTIIITKIDLATPDTLAAIKAVYSGVGCPVIPVCAKSGTGIEQVRREVMDSIAVFAGASGVGKSTLANALVPGLGLKMGSLSKKLSRGKHTTREVELYAVNEYSYIADTPGFSQLELDVEVNELQKYFAEFMTYSRHCAYRGCLHVQETDCGVKTAVAQGQISPSRYHSYAAILSEIQTREERRY